MAIFFSFLSSSSFRVFGAGAGWPSGVGLSSRSLPLSALSQRGVSYPPPSSRLLARALAVPQSRNPPLVKTGRLSSTASHGVAVGSFCESNLAGATLVQAVNIHVETPQLASLSSKIHSTDFASASVLF